MKRWHYILIGGFITLSVLGILVYGNRKGDVVDPSGRKESTAHRSMPGGTKARVHLYFCDETDGYLAAEERNLSMPRDVVAQSKKLVQALITGPETALRPTVPPQTRLLALYVTEKGVAYVDFDQAVRKEHGGGTLSELLTIYSVVNTLCLNISEIYAVKILVDGREEKTLSGHIDIQRPFKANLLMLKE